MHIVRRRTLTALAAAGLSVPLAVGAVAGVPAQALTRTSPVAVHQSAVHRSSAKPAAKPARVTFASTKASWATPQARSSTALRGGSAVSFTVSLKLRHQEQAEKAAVAASTPGHQTYRHYVTAAAFQKQYGASARTVGQLSAYFRGQGMRVRRSSWHGLTVTSTVRGVEKTFRTSLSLYRVGGQKLRAADRALSLPRSVGRHVQTVAGVTQSGTVRQPMTARPTEPTATAPSAVQPDSNYSVPPTCSSYWNQHQYDMPEAYGQTTFPTYICGYVPAQLRSAYGVDSAVAAGQDGSGTKVAIIDAYGSGSIRKDADTYATNRGDVPFGKDQFKEKLFKPFVNQDLCGGEAGWNGEETLDVEAVHGMAPGANVLYVGGSDCGAGIDAAQQWVVDHATDESSKAYGVSIVSNSYGYPGDEPNVIIDPAEQAMNHQTLIQAANEGIGYYFSSGDEGDNTVEGYSTRPQASYESSDPFATGVGGTSLAVDQNGQYLFETGWGSQLDPLTYNADGNSTGYGQPLPGSIFNFGAGGGVSTQFAQPYYQVGTVPDTLSQMFGTLKMRVAPDVAMDADPYTGFLIGESGNGSKYTESAIGGTSLAVPLFAALQAVTQGSGAHIGFANPLLYGLDASAFRDVVPPAQKVATPSASGHYLVTFDTDSSLYTAPGYDDVTGRGTPNGASFFDAERSGIAASTR